jgi:hypothetical protein
MQEQEWIAHLNACKCEGISLKAYAKEHKLSVDSLYYQRRKMTLCGLASTSATPSKASSTPTLFTRLQVGLSTESVRDNSIRLCLEGGLKLEMSSLPPVEWLAALARLEGAR